VNFIEVMRCSRHVITVIVISDLFACI